MLARSHILIFCLALCSCARPEPTWGTIKGHVLLPAKIDTAKAPKEARIYISLKDFAPKDGKKVLPWQAPVKETLDFQVGTVKDRKVAFEFKDVPPGTYGISVLIDTGRPHVPPGSTDFTTFPGDYAGGTKDDLKLTAGQTVEVDILEGLYVPVPEGYEAPVYSPE